jgi:O-antigen ligase
MTAQLIPLPPGIWAGLPGHARFLGSDAVAGLGPVWRPISLAPDLTLAALISLSVPLAMTVGCAALSAEQCRRLLRYVLAGVAVSAVIGVVQLVGGGREALYPYRVTNFGSAVGLFANRNHQAVLLAMAWPMAALWASLPAARGGMLAKRGIALALAIFLLPMILATGSRGGIVLGVGGILMGVVLCRPLSGASVGKRQRALIVAGALGAAFVVLTAAVLLSRDEALQRLVGVTPDEESRLQFIPVLVRMAADFFPVGAGFGGFDPLFRAYEPLALLKPTYFNHAHNDVLETLIAGGLPAALLMAVLALWFVRRAVALVRPAQRGATVAFARLGATIIALLCLSSLVDYPLRTPLFAALACLAWCWLADGTAERAAQSARGAEPQKTLR